jgi:alpha-1,2-mannosyltransferase
MVRTRSRAYLLGIILLLAYVNAAILVMNRLDLRSTPLAHAFHTYRGDIFWDSWKPMKRAYDHIRAHPDIPVYSELFFRQHVKFQYPVSSLLILTPFGAADLDGETIYRLLGALSVVPLAIVLVVCGMLAVSLLERGARDGELPTTSARWSVVSVTVIMAACFYPVYRAYYLGQVQLWIDALLVLGFWCYWSGYLRWTGVLLGVSALIKPQYVLFLVWAVLRRRWTVAAGFLAVFIPGSVVSVGIFGWENNVQYFSVLSYLSMHGESFFANQSVNGLLNRLLQTGPSLIFQENAFPAFHPVVYAMTISTSVIIVACSFILPLRWGGGGSLIDFSIILLTCTMASPIAWEHHYGVLLPIIILMFTRLDHFRLTERLVLYVSFLAVVADHSWTNRFADGWHCILQSYLFFGALCIMVLLYLVARRSGMAMFPLSDPKGI